ncbi:MAG: hypothetical protein HYX76_03345 [Acidobacteria bacterium]|nr:hypothetical protein [Acidobacteriota bacterium]
MATCPRCKGPLEDGHICTGLSRRIAWWIRAASVSIVAGGVGGGALFHFLGRLISVDGFEAAGMVIGSLALFAVMKSLRAD